MMTLFSARRVIILPQLAFVINLPFPHWHKRFKFQPFSAELVFRAKHCRVWLL